MRKSTIACMVCVICLVIAFVAPVIETSRAVEERGDAYQRLMHKHVPLVSLEELEAEQERVDLMVREAEPGDDPVGYFKTADEVFGLLSLRSKYSLNHRGFDAEFGRIHVRIQNTRMELAPLRTAYGAKFGHSAMTAIAPDYQWTNRQGLSKAESRSLPGFAGAWLMFQSAFLLSLIPAFALNVLRIHRRHLLFWPEIATLRIVAATIGWPALVWFYPTCVVRRDQVKLAVRTAAYAFSAAVSFGLGVAPAAAKSKKGKEKKEDGQEQTVKRDLSFEIEAYPLTPGSDSEYVSPTYLWDAWRLKGLGFAEIGPELPFLSNHILMADAPGPIDGRLEVGYGPRGTFSYFGPQVDANETPIRGVTSKVFAFLVYAHLFAANEGMPRQNSFFWRTREVQLGRGFSVLSEGWYRARYNTPDFGQPQLWLQKGGMKLGIELGIAGGEFSPRFGVKYAF